MKRAMALLIVLIVYVFVFIDTDAAYAEEQAGGGTPIRVTAEDLEGNIVSLPASGKKATVLVFVGPDCPVANRYAPSLEALHRDFASSGVVFMRIYSDKSICIDGIAKHTKDFGYTFAALRDLDQSVARSVGATRTPEVAVLDSAGRLVYRGRIDDRYADFGKYRQVATREDLREALDSVVAGRAVEIPRTQALGCYIHFSELSATKESE